MPEEKQQDEGHMTVSEAGHLGGEKGGKKGGEHSWTTGAKDADAPHLDKNTKEDLERIREKQARGEALTTHEAGVLGGASRAMDARGEYEERD